MITNQLGSVGMISQAGSARLKTYPIINRGDFYHTQ